MSVVNLQLLHLFGVLGALRVLLLQPQPSGGGGFLLLLLPALLVHFGRLFIVVDFIVGHELLKRSGQQPGDGGQPDARVPAPAPALSPAAAAAAH